MLKRLLRFPYRYFFSGADYRVSLYLKLIAFFKKENIRVAIYLANRMQRKYGVFVSPRAEFDGTLKLRHPVGIVVGDGVKLGKNVMIYQNVTLGGARLGDGMAGNYPEIGQNTVIFSGAAILGAIKIGENCIVGANSVVTKSMPDNCTVAGVPAKVIRRSNHE